MTCITHNFVKMVNFYVIKTQTLKIKITQIKPKFHLK